MKEYNKKPKSQPLDVSPPVPVALQGLGGSGGGSEANPLTCLYSNNSTESSNFKATDDALRAVNLLTNYHRKQAHTLTFNVQRCIDQALSLGHVAFMTLTFKENLVDFKEASKRFDSFNTHYLKNSPYFLHWIRCTERQKRGAVHYHLLIQTSENVSDGFNWDRYDWWLAARDKWYQNGKRGQKPILGTGGKFLRFLWKELRTALSKYGFGASELTPLRKNAEAVAYYIGKYISKHIGSREERDKGMRLISYSQGFIRSCLKFSWYNTQSVQWRWNLAKFADLMGLPTHDALSDRFGPRWAYKYREEIINIRATIEESNADIPF